MHSTVLMNEIRELEPSEDGWARYEATGRACAVCPCGLNTGFTHRADAVRLYREHTSAGQTVHVRLTAPEGSDAQLAERIRRMVRRDPPRT